MLVKHSTETLKVDGITSKMRAEFLQIMNNNTKKCYVAQSVYVLYTGSLHLLMEL
uniref:Uncharacterized protein n=1 Tax=Anguilla anguilla TaxID=7936 RepID=A0A0E9STF9_ANGAN